MSQLSKKLKSKKKRKFIFKALSYKIRKEMIYYLSKVMQRQSSATYLSNRTTWIIFFLVRMEKLPVSDVRTGQVSCPDYNDTEYDTFFFDIDIDAVTSLTSTRTVCVSRVICLTKYSHSTRFSRTVNVDCCSVHYSSSTTQTNKLVKVFNLSMRTLSCSTTQRRTHNIMQLTTSEGMSRTVS